MHKKTIIVNSNLVFIVFRFIVYIYFLSRYCFTPSTYTSVPAGLPASVNFFHSPSFLPSLYIPDFLTLPFGQYSEAAPSFLPFLKRYTNSNLPWVYDRYSPSNLFLTL